MAEIEIEIDGKTLKAQANQTVIQVADEAGIYIPRFCYHKNLSIPANCRMCLVEVEKSPKVLPACATPVAPGMKVHTQSAKTLAAQRAVMAFLLINHPLDCPICDQGGECELQDLSMGYGSPWSEYNEPKRAVPDQDLGPLIATEMTRCIYCTRCVRFGDEVAGLRELGVIGRGEFSEISTYIQHSIQSELSGNIIDLCPVGALTSKPFRFTARAWELDQFASISPHDCVGTNIYVHSRYGKVMRVVPRENKAINGTWIADRDRFSYTALYHEDRLLEPCVRKAGIMQPVGWEEALTAAAAALIHTKAQHGAEAIGALISPSSTLEEFYLLQKLMRQLGSPNIDHRLREVDVGDQRALTPYSGLGAPLASLADAEALLLIGSNIQKEQPMIAAAVRQAFLKNAAILAINPIDYPFNFEVLAKEVVAPQDFVGRLQTLYEQLKHPQSMEHPFAHHLHDKKRIFILLGAMVFHHPEAAQIRFLAQKIALHTGAQLVLLPEGANALGGKLAGAIPYHGCGEEVEREGLSAHQMIAEPRRAYVMFNVEPEFDCADAISAIKALSQANAVIAISLYKNPILEDHADVILPVGPFTETAGTFVNASGEWQAFGGCAQPYGASRPGWKILRALANFLQLSGFEYERVDEVTAEIKEKLKGVKTTPFQLPQPNEIKTAARKLSRVGEIPIYAIDGITRRAKPLQNVQEKMEGVLAVAKIHPQTAKEYGLVGQQKVRVTQGNGQTILPLVLDKRIALRAVSIAGGMNATNMLGELFGEVQLEPVQESSR